MSLGNLLFLKSGVQLHKHGTKSLNVSLTNSKELPNAKKYPVFLCMYYILELFLDF